MFPYEVTYITVSGKYTLPSRNLTEAKADAKRLRELNKQPGYLASGIKIRKVK